ncbi:MAG: STAS domain-containing protein [Pseudomonadota bacterium]
MASQVLVSITGNEVHIKVNGRFDFSVHKEFRAAYEEALKDVAFTRCVIDLQSTEYIDSSALGMLLMMRERIGGRAKIELVHCNKEIRNTLDISNFHKLFEIH